MASGRAIWVRSILELIARETGAEDFVRYGTRPLRADEPEVIEADVARLLDEVAGPRYDLDSGLADTISWWTPQLGLSI